MSKEDKELLLKDICARLPYKPQVVYNGVTETLSTLHIFDMTHLKEECVDIKPYLRSMDSMTEEEFREYNQNETCVLYEEGILNGQTITSGESVDWLNAHHFDFRGLIEKGLALEAPEDMYKTK
jgi:hypothetical protein